MTIIEFTAFPSSGAHTSEGAENLKRYSSYLTSYDAVESSAVYYGTRVEDGNIGHVIVGYEACNTAAEYKAAAPPHVFESSSNQPFVIPFHFTEDYRKAIAPLLSAPVTQMIVITPKSAELFEETKSKFMKVVEVVTPYAKEGGHSCGVAVGTSIEEPKRFLLLCGWDSIEDDIATTRSDAFKEAVKSLAQTGCTRDVFHVKLLGV